MGFFRKYRFSRKKAAESTFCAIVEEFGLWFTSASVHTAANLKLKAHLHDDENAAFSR